jgi:aminopeptidase N
MTGRLAAVVLAITLPSGTAHAGRQTPAPAGAAGPFRVAYYDLRLEVRPDARLLRGCVTAVGRIGAASLARLDLDLAPAMVVDSAVARARGTSGPLTVAREGYTLGLTPRIPWKAREPLDITVCYHGTPSETALTFAGRGDSARVGSYGLPYSAREWWPSRDSPAQKADSADIEITAPGALTAVSNGRLVGRVQRDSAVATTHWAVRYPIYPDVISLAIARYRTFALSSRTALGASLPMQFFVFPEDEAKARIDFSVLPQILAHHTARLGDYPFLREKYGVAEFPVESFREHQTIASYGPRFITGDHRNDWILAHELAHQWFGDALTVRNWSDVWLNEGFATYAAFLWLESARGKAAYDSVVAARMKLDFPGSVYITDSTDVDHMFGPVTFFKGALVLHMLRHVMGDSLFFRSLRRYVTENRYKNVTTAAFQAVCERTLNRSLDWFFKEWVFGTGAPAYTLKWTQRRAARGFDVDVTLDQTQEGAVFTMPVDLLLHTTGGDLHKVGMDNLRTISAKFSSADSVIAVSLDPGNWILKRSSP